MVIFLASLFTPKNNDWNKAINGDWVLDKSSIIGKILHIGEDASWMIDGCLTNVFYVDMSRLLLLGTFIGLALMVRHASKLRKQKK